METRSLTKEDKAQEQLSSLIYQASVIIELEISELVQSATNIMSETDVGNGYYS